MRASAVCRRLRQGCCWLVLLGLCQPVGARAEDIPAPPGRISASFFGIHVHRGHDVRLQPRLPFGALRLWDAGVAWSQLEPTPDRHDYVRLDLMVALAERQGMEVLYTAGRTPAWAARQPQAGSFYAPGESSPPRELASFGRYLAAIAQRYGARIPYFEVWNEPASSGMFAGSIDDMVALTQEAARAVKAVNPQARIVCPSPAKQASLDWLGRFLARGGARHCDVLGYHFYTDSERPEDKWQLIQAVRSVLRQHGAEHLDIWDSESGFALTAVAGQGTAGQVGAPAHLARWLILDALAGIKRFYWYSWDHGKFGFVDPQTAQPRNPRAIQAYATVRQWLLDARILGGRHEQGHWQCRLRLADGRVATIHWLEAGAPAVVLTLAAGSSMADLYGYVARLSTPLALSLQAEPVLIVEGG